MVVVAVSTASFFMGARLFTYLERISVSVFAAAATVAAVRGG